MTTTTTFKLASRIIGLFVLIPALALAAGQRAQNPEALLGAALHSPAAWFEVSRCPTTKHTCCSTTGTGAVNPRGANANCGQRSGAHAGTEPNCSAVL